MLSEAAVRVQVLGTETLRPERTLRYTLDFEAPLAAQHMALSHLFPYEKIGSGRILVSFLMKL